MRTTQAWISILLICFPTRSSLAFAANPNGSQRRAFLGGVPHGGSRKVAIRDGDDTVSSSTVSYATKEESVTILSDDVNVRKAKKNSERAYISVQFESFQK